MKIYISTANQYLKLTKVFAYLFNKFWNVRDIRQEVIIVGYDKPDFDLPDNFSFISMGEQIGGIQAWSTDLKRFFESIDDEHFIWTLEDAFLSFPVNHIILNHVMRNYLTHDLGRFGLTNDNKGRPHSVIEQPFNSCQVIESEQTVNYRLSGLWSIWNREYLLKYMVDGWSPWEFEIHGSDKARNDGFRILGTRNDYVVQTSLGVRKGNLNQPLSFNFINDSRTLDDASINEMREKGIIDEENRISN